MSGKITFVGAGPGAPDLITIRGAEALKQAGLVVYAGSLVNEKLLELAEHAELVNSAKLALEEVLELLVSGFRAGKRWCACIPETLRCTELFPSSTANWTVSAFPMTSFPA